MVVPHGARDALPTSTMSRRDLSRAAIAAALSAGLGHTAAGCRPPATGQPTTASAVNAAPTPSPVLSPSTPPASTPTAAPPPRATSTAGWRKHDGNPVLGKGLGTVFDVALLQEGGRYRMWFSWRDRAAIALAESADGAIWAEHRIVLPPRPESDWEKEVNRPVVVKAGGMYHMWYTGQAPKGSWIGYATSPDGAKWTRAQARPVLAPMLPWEKTSVMCPHVIWDESERAFRMWYSGGEQYEPDAIGYATSADGIAWKRRGEPIFRANEPRRWDGFKVTACQVMREGGWHLMFYIGFSNINRASIGLARSRDGIAGWERHPANPIIAPTTGAWDADATYKPYAIRNGDRWLLWYNGRRERVEQIGLAIHEGADLGFGD